MKENLWSKFNAVAKNCKVKNIVEQLVKSTFGKSSLQSYQTDVEAIYAFSRLTPMAEINRKKFINADMKWQESIIMGDDEKMYKPFVDKYGKENVVKAVKYLIESELWDAPKGDVSLRVHSTENYKGMAEIETAIIYMSEQGKLDIPDEAKEAEPVEIEMVDDVTEETEVNDAQNGIEFDLPKVGDVISKFENGRHSIELLLSALTDVNAIMPEIKAMFDIEVDENIALKQQHEDDIKKVEEAMEIVKKNEEKMKQNEESCNNRVTAAIKENVKNKKRVDELEKEVERIKGTCTGLRNDIAKLERENAEYKRTNEAMKNASQQASLPKKKQIKRDDLLGVPLLGPAVLKGLIPLFEKNGIIVI